MKKLLLIVLMLVILPLFIACEEKPHEECVTEWTQRIDDKPLLFVSVASYVLETEYGDVTVSKKIYETAQDNGYSQICVYIESGEDLKLVGATRINGTPEDSSLIDEIQDQIIKEEENTNE